MLVHPKPYFKKAQRKHYAIPAFNVFNVETMQAVIRAAERLKSPVILQTSESALEYAGLEVLSDMLTIAAKRASIPVILHLDHGKTMKTIRRCMTAGYTSLMVDGSSLPFAQNVQLTRQVVIEAHAHHIAVEGELGIIGGMEDDIKGSLQYTDPEQAATFIELTGIDTLAVAIGTSHGVFKPRSSQLRLDLLAHIREKVSIPLVLHGASLVDKLLIEQAKAAGIELQEAKGIPGKDIKRAVQLGICKINVDTDLRLVFSTALRVFLKNNPKSTNPRQALAAAEHAMEAEVERHIELFGSKGKA